MHMEVPMEEKPFPAWSWSVEQCLKEYAVEVDKGLSTYEVEKLRCEKYGWNELAKEKGKPLWQLVLEQFDDMLVKILLLAAFISFVLAYFDGSESGFEAYVEPLVILLILVLNAIVGVWQENNAEKALEALKELQCESAKVLRDGNLVPDLPARELVPGDVVELHVGDKVPADMRVAALKTSTLRVEQSSLTGEAMPVLKGTNPIFLDDCELQAKENMVFSGTTVVNGSCVCIVITTGMNTEIGKIQKQIHEASLEDNDTPLKKKLDEFGGRLTTAIGVVCLIVWVINYKNFLSWDIVDGWPSNIQFSFGKCTYYFKIAVALAVAAIPEGLPAVITTCLALGTRKMAQKNAIVRKLPSVETLGCTTVICSDKTGTLTTNQMSVTEFFTLGGKTNSSRVISVEGTTYNPNDGGIVDWTCYNMDVNLVAMAEICAVCNDAGIYFDGRLFRATGLPTEAALKVLVEKMGVPDMKSRNKIRDTQLAAKMIGCNTLKLGCCEWWNKRSKKIATLEFDRIRKSMSVIVREPDGQNRLLVKGAVESLLERSSYVQLADGSLVPTDEQCRELLLQRLLEMSSKGLRCLGMAYKDDLGEFSDYYADTHPAHKKLLDPACYSLIESGLVFVGVVGIRDPPRQEVHEAIEDCKKAGIRVMVITGDNRSTAEAICREIKLFSKDEDLTLKSLTGKEFTSLSHSEKVQILSRPGGKVFSRAEPRHKQDIVRLLKELGEIVAMTGDGVNDAPALKLADIGIAMGITGTEVAKEASDMVLADDNFSTIVSAIAEGRSIYNNMKAFIRYMISSNVGEVISIFLTAALGIPECMIPVQLLWVNLVTDGPPATALGFNPADVDIMQKPPRKSDDALISSWVLLRYLIIGSYVGIATVGIFVLWYTQASFLGINLVSDGHTIIELSQLRNWGECHSWSNFTAVPYTVGNGRVITFSNPCDYFSVGKVKAMTLSLSVLVAIEMFNSLNALSEDNSLRTLPPWRNPWLLLAMSMSLGLHCVILYIPLLNDVFGVVPLSLNEWFIVILISSPVILIDEILKFVVRSQRKMRKEKAA
ncbi:PREDICTED: calcium-transporting ATPase, endoplasmic reticulum-type [Lupinus angustifolius]|uniref:calcium-transporting ATPase, endoplasmic reticulum-type n=1 Tax=Lupinus angustifolius TaxID=3871 RepID=UPI00092F8E76|nr:PREDICTED: calcium-transporting ATPase, endoplasmic reticulum-type [Lupinus angustifolius]XP_019422323.1 PREDICTED: calcium-transporting ATPase, endoplasmic reticulum-type [Lupinus angustifolius]